MTQHLDALEVTLARALGGLAPSTVRVGALIVDDRHLPGLHPGEEQAIDGAGARRRREFATGRALLRSLLDRPIDIGVLASRAPALPTDVRASLAHDAEVAVAAVAAAGEVTALGIDVEPVATLRADEAAVILRADDPDIDPVLGFVCKEATYKAWAGAGGGMLEFDEVRLEVADGTFRASVRDGAVSYEGRYCAVAGRWAALVVA